RGVDGEEKFSFRNVDDTRGPVLQRIPFRVEDRMPQAARRVGGILALGFGNPVFGGYADVILLGRDRGSAGGESGRHDDSKKNKQRRQPALSTLRELDQGPVILPAARPRHVLALVPGRDPHPRARQSFTEWILQRPTGPLLRVNP